MDKVYLVFVDNIHLVLATNVKSKVMKFLSGDIGVHNNFIKLVIYENGEFSNEFECELMLDDDGVNLIEQRDLDEFKAMI